MSTLRRIPPSIWALGFVSLLMDVSSELIHSLLPVFMVTTLGATALMVGMVEGMAEATAQIVKVFSGPLSDYWGKRKPLTMVGYGLGALSKPLFAVATSIGLVVFARLADRIGKGIRGAPRDALVADLAPAELRGAAFGLRQSLDTIGAFLGPLAAMGLMVLWANDFHRVFWVAVIPAFLSVALLFFGVREPERAGAAAGKGVLRFSSLKRLRRAYWWVVVLGAVFTLARFSEAFLILRARDGGVPIGLVPLVLIGMNAVFALSAYPFGKLSDALGRTSMGHSTLLGVGLIVLIGADAALAYSNHWTWVAVGIALWGLHMGMTQGLLATMVAETAPADLRGTGFGVFNLSSGLATLTASSLAGWMWDRFGPAFTFLLGIGFCVAALGLIGAAPRTSSAGKAGPDPRA